MIIHTADADSMANARWFYDGIKAKGVSWDITGLSYYSWNPANINRTGDQWDSLAIFDWTGQINPNVKWTP